MTSTFERQCIVCGRALPAPVRGRPTLRCKECKSVPGKGRPDLPCVDCGALFTPNQTGRVPLRCKPCAAERLRATSTERSREWVKNNPERAREHSRKNSAKYRILNPDYVKGNNDKFNAKYRLDPAFAERRKYHRLKASYGLTRENYHTMEAAQDNRCAICRGEHVGPGTLLHVDHDHSTGAIRGLLCSNCNTALGLLGDDIVRVEAAAAYLRLHGVT